MLKSRKKNEAFQGLIYNSVLNHVCVSVSQCRKGFMGKCDLQNCTDRLTSIYPAMIARIVDLISRWSDTTEMIMVKIYLVYNWSVLLWCKGERKMSSLLSGHQRKLCFFWPWMTVAFSGFQLMISQQQGDSFSVTPLWSPDISCLSCKCYIFYVTAIKIKWDIWREFCRSWGKSTFQTGIYGTGYYEGFYFY